MYIYMYIYLYNKLQGCPSKTLYSVDIITTVPSLY